MGPENTFRLCGNMGVVRFTGRVSGGLSRFGHYFNVGSIMGSRMELGSKGEELAVVFLKKRGYTILEKNFRCKFGEIDIIARERKTLVFVEVKTRSSLGFGSPQTSVTRKKQDQLTKVALFYLQKKQLFNCEARFDVVAVELNSMKKQIELIRNAFEIAL